MSPCRKADSIVLEASLKHGHEKPCRDDTSARTVIRHR